MKPGEHQVVDRRLYELFSSAPPPAEKKKQAVPPSANLSGTWDVDIEYEVGAARHRLFLAASGNHLTGSHQGWAFQGDLTGEIDGGCVKLRSSLPAEGNRLSYMFTGSVSAESISGDVELGEYGRARWHARRHGSPS
jgi:L-seryl-tRNA(Ser) seleniumtransferase